MCGSRKVMKKTISVFLTLILSFCAVAFSGCSGNKVLTFSAFGTFIYVQSNDKKISSKTEEQLIDLFSSLDEEFSLSKENSLINLFNGAETGSTTRISPRFREVFNTCVNMYEFTNKTFNPSIVPLLDLWQFSNYKVLNFSPPTQEQIDIALAKCDFSSITLVEDGLTKTKDVKLDFGGILKGYAVDLALEILRNAGHEKGFISVGNSSLALLGVNELSIIHPSATNKNIISVDCKNNLFQTLSTSGDYERFYDYNGVRYSHIIDARTGYTATTGITSATLIGISGIESDALTTALCATSHNPTDFTNSDLVNLLKQIETHYSGVEFYVVYNKDGVKQILTNKKQGEDFTLLDTEYSVKNI